MNNNSTRYAVCDSPAPDLCLLFFQELRHVLIPGSTIPPPVLDKVPSWDVLGKGGNGRIFRHQLMGHDFAVKAVSLSLKICYFTRAILANTHILLQLCT